MPDAFAVVAPQGVAEGGDPVTEVNAHNDNGDDEPVAPEALSVAVLLTATADLIIGRELPEPVQVDVSAGSRPGLDVELASHADLSAWSQVLELRRWPWSSQPYVADGVLCQLTNVYGRWRDTRIRVHCLEPVDAIAVLRDEEPPR